MSLPGRAGRAQSGSTPDYPPTLIRIEFGFCVSPFSSAAPSSPCFAFLRGRGGEGREESRGRRIRIKLLIRIILNC